MLKIKNKPSIFIACCFCLSIITHSQNKTQDTIQARKHIVIADSLQTAAKYDSAVVYYHKAAKVYKTHKIWKAYMQAKNSQGGALLDLGNCLLYTSDAADD